MGIPTIRQVKVCYATLMALLTTANQELEYTDIGRYAAVIQTELYEILACSEIIESYSIAHD